MLLLLLLLLASAAALAEAAEAAELSVGDCPLLCRGCAEDKLLDGWTAFAASVVVAGVTGVGGLRLHRIGS